MSPTEKIASLKKLIFYLGSASAYVLEQMIKGNWVDDHGHPVRNNASIMALAASLDAACNHAEKMNETYP